MTPETTDTALRRLLTEAWTIAAVGPFPKPDRASRVMAPYLGIPGTYALGQSSYRLMERCMKIEPRRLATV